MCIMRIAILLYGQPRSYLNGHELIRKFLANQTNVEVDFLYHCWTITPGDYFPCSPWRNISKSELEYNPDTPDRLRELYNPVAFLYEPQIMDFNKNLYENTLCYNNTTGRERENVNNTLSQMYSLNAARNILNSYIENTGTAYDYVVVYRFDGSDSEKLLTVDLSNLTDSLYLGNTHRPRNIFTAHLLIAPPHIILKMLNFFSRLQDLIDNPMIFQLMSGIWEHMHINMENIATAKYLLEYGDLHLCTFKTPIIDVKKITKRSLRISRHGILIFP